MPRLALLYLMLAPAVIAADYVRTADVHQSGIPLGGMGAGTVQLRSDGLLHEWEMFNNPIWIEHNDHPVVGGEDAGFAVWMKKPGAPPVVRHLSIRGAQKVPGQREHEVMWYNLYLLPWLKNVDRIDYTGEFPYATLTYHSEGMPIQVSLEAYTPFVPGDAKNSALPGAYFTFTLKNPTSDPYDVSVLSILKNLVAYDLAVASKELSIKVRDEDGMTAFTYGCGAIDATRPSNGTMTLACLDGQRTWTCGYTGSFNPLPEWNAAMFFWPQYRSHGRLANQAMINRATNDWTGSDPWHGGVLASRVALAPGESKQVRFILGWHFPNNPGTESGRRQGHIYSRWFADSDAVVAYLRAQEANLSRRTRAFHDAVYAGTLDPWLADALNAQLATLCKISWWTADDVFSIWEGYGTFGPGSPIDVMYYGDIPIVLMFPELGKNIIENQNIRKDRKDCQPQYVMWTWRTYEWTGDKAFLARRWATLEAQIDYALERDTDGDGITDNEGADTSYDNFRMYGTSCYVGFIWLCALRSMEEGARLQGDMKAVKRYQQLYARSRRSLEQRLWNGKYYDLYNDPGGMGRSNCCMADQLNGQWYAHLGNLGYLVDPARVKSSLESVYRINRSFEEGLVNGVWPDESSHYANSEHFPSNNNWTWATPWTGTEYAVAQHMMMEGMVEEGLSIAREAYDRYDIGMTWNHVECGGAYSRAMSVWGVLLALQGWKYDAPKAHLTLDPVYRGENFDSVFLVPGAWGRLTQKKSGNGAGELNLSISDGSLALRELTVGLSGKQTSVALGGRPVDCKFEKDGGGTCVTFAPPVRLSSGDTLRVQAR